MRSLHALVFVAIHAGLWSCKARDTSAGLKEVSAEYNKPPRDYRILDQGWTKEEREDWYWTGQGSMLIPYQWFLRLRTPNGDLFRSDKVISKFAVSVKPTARNPDGLPIGFVKGVDGFSKPNEKIADDWMGFTCAACHTSEIRVNGRTMRIEGGAPLFDHTMFRAELKQSIDNTLADKNRLSSLKAELQAAGQDVKDFEDKFERYAAWFEEYFNEGKPEPLDHFGPGRLDAIGMEMNQFVMTSLKIPENYRVPDAPVSYPHVWNTPDLEWVQWNGLAKIPIERNIGEAIGVFGRVNLSRGPELFSTNIDFEGLDKLEQTLRTLKSPVWQEDWMGKLDPEKVARGRELFTKTFSDKETGKACSSCHVDIATKTAPQNGKEFIPVTMVPLETIGTDPTFIKSLLSRTAKSGALEGIPYGKDKDGNDILVKPVDAAATLLKISIGGIVKRYFEGLPDTPESKAKMLQMRNNVPLGVVPVPPNLKAYKARPLNGIWATAPFLHNGSVPNLYEMLLPAKKRSKSFYLGSIDMDLKKVGYFTEKSSQNDYLFDTSLKGNANTGHEYGVDYLSEKDRWDLIEYLKSI